MIKPAQPGEPVTPLPSDLAVLDSTEAKKDLPCTVVQRKPELGFDLHFHTGFDVTVPMKELAGTGELLSMVFRVYPQGDKEHPVFFVQHFRVPYIEEDAKGDAFLQGVVDVGEGQYHVDWLMRDRTERFCSSNWDVTATISQRDKGMPLFIKPNAIEEFSYPFAKEDFLKTPAAAEDRVRVKVLVNFAPEDPGAAAFQRPDVDALVSLLRAITRDSRVDSISLIAFNLMAGKVLYRQDGKSIDFESLGKSLGSVKLGIVNIDKLGDKRLPADFLDDLINKEVGTGVQADAIVFAGPKAMLDENVPDDDLRRIGDIERPVFYLNYNPDPQDMPWKDAISRAIKAFRGTEYTISRPRDLWFCTSEMLSRIIQSKRTRAMARAATGGTD